METVRTLYYITASAAIAGALYWFILRRAWVQKLNIDHHVQFVALKSEVYVGITVVLQNIGNVKLKNLSPVNGNNVVIIEELSPYLNKSKVSQEKSPEYKLEFLGARTFPELIELEPGEIEKILFEFIIQPATQAIKVYSYLDNAGAKDVGWNRTTIHEVEA